jgi:hypothetical protein
MLYTHSHRGIKAIGYLDDQWYDYTNTMCRNPTLAKCGGEAQHLEKLEIWSPPGVPNV